MCVHRTQGSSTEIDRGITNIIHTPENMRDATTLAVNGHPIIGLVPGNVVDNGRQRQFYFGFVGNG